MAPRHHPRHGHATPPCQYCDWPLNGETLGTRREKAERTHLTNAEADRRGRGGSGAANVRVRTMDMRKAVATTGVRWGGGGVLGVAGRVAWA